MHESNIHFRILTHKIRSNRDQTEVYTRFGPVFAWTYEHQYTVDQVLKDMIDRCKELKLRVEQFQRATTTQTMLMVTVQTMNFLNDGHYRFAL